MTEPTYETIENIIIDEAAKLLDKFGIPFDNVPGKGVFIEKTILLQGDSRGIVLGLLYEAICTGYLLGYEEGMQAVYNNL